MSSRWISLAAAGDGFSGYLAFPAARKGPGIILLQEIFGVNTHIRSVADQYAMDGYVVLAPDIFWRKKLRAEFGYGPDDASEALAFMRSMDYQQAVEDIATAVNVLRGLPECNGHVTSLGYCMGGTLSYLSAANAGVDAAVCYYGGGISKQLALVEKITVPMLLHFAAEDSNIPMTAIDEVKQALGGHDQADIYVYPGAMHGFNCWARESYNQRAAALARGRTLEFLATTAA